MMCLSDWVNALKYVGSKETKRELTTIIKSQCLCNPPKDRWGAYRIDENLIWECIVMKDSNISKDRIKSPIDIESVYYSHVSQVGYHYAKHVYSRYHTKK